MKTAILIRGIISKTWDADTMLYDIRDTIRTQLHDIGSPCKIKVATILFYPIFLKKAKVRSQSAFFKVTTNLVSRSSYTNSELSFNNLQTEETPIFMFMADFVKGNKHQISNFAGDADWYTVNNPSITCLFRITQMEPSDVFPSSPEDLNYTYDVTLHLILDIPDD